MDSSSLPHSISKQNATEQISSLDGAFGRRMSNVSPSSSRSGPSLGPIASESGDETTAFHIQRTRHPTPLSIDLKATEEPVQSAKPDLSRGATTAPIAESTHAVTQNVVTHVESAPTHTPPASARSESVSTVATPRAEKRGMYRFMEKHVQSLLNPHSNRDMILRVAGYAVIMLLIVILVLNVNQLRSTNEEIMTSGPRFEVEVKVSGDVPSGTIVSSDVASGTALIGFGVQNEGTEKVIPLSAAAHSTSRDFLQGLKGFFGSFPVRDNDKGVKGNMLVSHDASVNTISFAWLWSLSSEAPRNDRFTMPLVHTQILSVCVHGEQQHTGEFDVLVVYQDGSANVMYAVSISFSSNQATHMTAPVTYDHTSSLQHGDLPAPTNDTFTPGPVHTTWLHGLPLRFVISSSGWYGGESTASTGVTLFHLVESSSTHHFSRLYTAVSGYVAAGRLLDMAPVQGGMSRFFVVLTATGVVLAGMNAEALSEKDVRSFACSTAVPSAEQQHTAPENPASARAVLAYIKTEGGVHLFAASCPIRSYALTVSPDTPSVDVHSCIANPQPHQQQTQQTTGSPSGRSAFGSCEAPVGESSAVIPFYSFTNGATVYVVGWHPEAGDFSMTKLVQHGDLSDVYVSEQASLPFLRGRHVVGFDDFFLYSYDVVQHAVVVTRLQWKGGMRMLGITQSRCKRTSSCRVLLKGLFETEDPSLMPSYPLYSTPDGLLTSVPGKASLRSHVAHAISTTDAFADFLSF